MFILSINLTLSSLILPTICAADPNESTRREELRRMVNLRLNPLTSFSQSLPQLDEYTTALRTRANTRGITNLQISDRFIMPNIRCYTTGNFRHVGQCITYTHNGVRYCRLMIARVNESGAIVHFEDMNFQYDQLQRLASQAGFGNINPNNTNETLLLISFFQRPTNPQPLRTSLFETMRIPVTHCYFNSTNTMPPAIEDMRRSGFWELGR